MNRETRGRRKGKNRIRNREGDFFFLLSVCVCVEERKSGEEEK